MTSKQTIRRGQVALAAALCLGMAAAQAAHVQVTLSNVQPDGGLGIAPLWLGFHDGSFDAFDVGSAASVGIERAAEDGNAAVLSSLFAASTPTGVQGTLPGPPAFPGAVRTLGFDGVDLSGAGRYLSYAAMVVVSNDFFVGNDNPLAFDLSSIAQGGKLTIYIGGAGHVYDAGTEVNDFHDSLANGAFGIGGGQSMANQGVDEGGVVHVVTGNPYLSFLGQDLVPSGYQWGALDFNASGLPVARLDIEVTPVPEPSGLALTLAGLGGMAAWRRLRARRA
jgi:hypothetical protein